MEATRGEVTGHAMKLEEELEHTKRVQGETAERLVSRSADVESVTRSLASIVMNLLFHTRVTVTPYLMGDNDNNGNVYIFAKNLKLYIHKHYKNLTHN